VRVLCCSWRRGAEWYTDTEIRGSTQVILGVPTFACFWVHLDFSSPLVSSRSIFLIDGKQVVGGGRSAWWLLAS